MKRYFQLIFIVFLVTACAPVLSKHMRIQGTFSPSLSEVRQNPDEAKGRVFILGGVIVNTTATKEGSLIEAIYVPVNSWGYLKSLSASTERFMAIQRGGRLLDPLIYGNKREITLAGEFIGMREGKIGELEYSYPLFDIKEIHLWEEIKERDYYYYYMPPPYPYLYYRHRMHDPWWWY